MKKPLLIIFIGLLFNLNSFFVEAQIPNFDWTLKIQEVKQKNFDKHIWQEISESGVTQLTYDGSFLNRKIFITYIFVQKKLNKISYAFIDEDNSYSYKEQELIFFLIRKYLIDNFGENDLVIDERGLSSTWEVDNQELFHIVSKVDQISEFPIHHLEFREVKN